MIEDHLGLVRQVAKRFWGRGTDMEDLVQIGVIGLIKAVDRFDDTRGLKFSTYAVPMILGEIRQFLRDDGPIKISRTIRENAALLSRIRASEYARLGREPGIQELAAAADLGREDVILALESTGSVLSLECAAEGEDGRMVPFEERITADGSGGRAWVGERSDASDPEKNKLIDHLALEQLWEGLQRDEQKLLFYRYFRDMTQAECAKILGISQVQVGRREKNILRKLRDRVNS